MFTKDRYYHVVNRLSFLLLIFIFFNIIAFGGFIFLGEEGICQDIGSYGYSIARCFYNEFSSYFGAMVFLVYPFFFFLIMKGYITLGKLDKNTEVFLSNLPKSEEIFFKRKMVFFYPFSYFGFVILLAFLDKNKKFNSSVEKLYQFIGSQLESIELLFFLSIMIFIGCYNLVIWIKNTTIYGRRAAKIVFSTLNITFIFPALFGLYYFVYYKIFPFSNEGIEDIVYIEGQKSIILLLNQAFPICILTIFLTILFQFYLWLLHDKLADKLTNKLSYWQKRKVKKLG